MTRMGDIMRADELKADKDAYEAWLKKTRAEKQAAYKATIEKTGNKRSNVGVETGFIFPFGIDQTKKIVLGVGLIAPGKDLGDNEEAESSLITKLREAVIGTALYGNIGTPAAGSIVFDVARKKIKPAKVKLVQIGDDVEGVKSRITDRPYSYRKKNSVSCSFGQKIGTATDYETAKIALRKALETDSKYTTYFTPQGEIDIAIIAASA
jgi:hypothetical protein